MADFPASWSAHGVCRLQYSEGRHTACADYNIARAGTRRVPTTMGLSPLAKRCRIGLDWQTAAVASGERTHDKTDHTCGHSRRGDSLGRPHYDWAANGGRRRSERCRRRLERESGAASLGKGPAHHAQRSTGARQLVGEAGTGEAENQGGCGDVRVQRCVGRQGRQAAIDHRLSAT